MVAEIVLPICAGGIVGAVISLALLFITVGMFELVDRIRINRGS